MGRSGEEATNSFHCRVYRTTQGGGASMYRSEEDLGEDCKNARAISQQARENPNVPAKDTALSTIERESVCEDKKL